MKISNKNNLRFLVLSFIMMFTLFSYGQSVTVVLSKDNSIDKRSDIENQDCYKIQLKNKSAKAAGLAGQNYRLYYNSDAVILDEERIKNFLPNSYTSIKLVQHEFNVDASGFGLLPFESNLGFINLATDFKLSAEKPIMIGVGETVDVAEICFTIKDETLTPDYTWAREDLTQTYATAFVEITMLENKKLKKMQIDDFVVSGTRTSVWQEENMVGVEYFPNPFKDRLEIKFDTALETVTQLEVSDVLGRLIQTIELNKGTKHFSLIGDNIPDGPIVLKVKHQGGDIATFKAVKMK